MNLELYLRERNVEFQKTTYSCEFLLWSLESGRPPINLIPKNLLKFLTFCPIGIPIQKNVESFQKHDLKLKKSLVSNQNRTMPFGSDS